MRQVTVTALYLQEKKLQIYSLATKERFFILELIKKYQYHSLPMVKNARPLVLIFAAGEPKLKALSWNSSCVYVHSSLRTPDRELSATSNNFSSDLHQFTEPLRLYVEWYQAKYMYLTKKKFYQY